MDELKAAEAAYEAALAAYQSDRTPELKLAYREAAQALTAARESRRGSTVVTPPAVAVTVETPTEG